MEMVFAGLVMEMVFSVCTLNISVYIKISFHLSLWFKPFSKSNI